MVAVEQKKIRTGRPNFFIVGAPRCGTTSLYNWLRRHPDVFLTNIKEPHFFSGAARTVPNLPKYEAMFAAGRDKPLRGEASTSYLWSVQACQRIHEYAPDARIVIGVRHPVDLLRAWHANRCFYGAEPVWDLGEALAIDDRAERGEAPPWRYRGRRPQHYRTRMDLAPMIRRYQETFGKKQVHAYLLDDMVTDSAKVYADVCAFLGIAPMKEERLPARNVGRWPRSRVLSSLLGRAPKSPFWRDQLWYRRSLEKIRALNMAPGGRPELQPELRARLDAEFKPQREDLEGLLHRPLKPSRSKSRS